MYVVVAGGKRAGLPLADREVDAAAEPVGVRHAVPLRVEKPDIPLAICGADVAGWVLFDSRPFEPGAAASCQRCSQLVTWVARWRAAHRAH